MAISGILATLNKQSSKRFNAALNYLESTDLDAIFRKVVSNNPIEVEIDGRNVFAIFQCYETKPLSEAKMEGHKKYIDIQYINKGVEQILVTPTSRITKDDAYDKNRDVYFPKVVDYSNFRLTAGMGCILYPEDLHAPGISIDAPTKVEKIVIKVKTE